MSGDNLNHYVAKAAITRCIVEGTPAQALCAAFVACTAQSGNAMPGSETANRDFKVCPVCEIFHDGLGVEQEAKEVTHA